MSFFSIELNWKQSRISHPGRSPISPTACVPVVQCRVPFPNVTVPSVIPSKSSLMRNHFQTHTENIQTNTETEQDGRPYTGV